MWRAAIASRRVRSYATIDGIAVARGIREALRADIEQVKRSTPTFAPRLAIIQVGERADSTAYVTQKMKATKEVGVEATKILLPQTATQAQLVSELRKLNADPSVHGIIVQMPLPKHMDSQAILDLVDHSKDVDGFHVRNVGELAKRNGHPLFLPCTAAGVMKLLESVGVDPKGKRAVVMGRSDIIGMPVFQLLQKAGATVTLVHTGTVDVPSITREADILVVAAGVPQMVGREHIKPGAVVIDVGIHSVPNSKRLVGDVKFEEVSPVASAVTPVPGGVGPMTVAVLLENTVLAAKRSLQRPRMEFLALDIKEPVPSDDVICRVTPKRILQLASEVGIAESELDLVGPYKGKVSLSLLERLKDAPKGKMVVVTGCSPTALGEGKTTCLLGLVQALNVQLGTLAFGTLRQPSQGPTFGVKGGAAGGGYSQVIPMSDVNLHLTGDIHAVAAAHNLMCAAVDARILHEGSQSTEALFKRLIKKNRFAAPQLEWLRKLGIHKTDPSTLTPEEMERFARLNMDPATVSIRRVVDCNDRFLRSITIGHSEKGFERQSGFDIAVSSEVMAILALAKDLPDLRQRLSRIIVARNKNGDAVTAGDVGVAGAMAALLHDAIRPNLLQTLEGTPLFLHAGPFANIAHGQSSVLADEMALRLVGPNGFVVTESGFGSDMGWEKFVAIKSRASGTAPDCAVLVVSSRAMREHGAALVGEKASPREQLEAGSANLRRHVSNIRTHYGTPVVVAITRPEEDKSDEHQILARVAKEAGAFACIATHGWQAGSKGAQALAEAVLGATAGKPTPPLRQLYSLEDSLENKIRAVATKIYGAKDVEFSPKATEQLRWMAKQGLDKLPLCMAKTPLSFSHDPALKGAPSGFTFPIVDVRVSAGAGFVYPLAGSIMTMPGLGTRPGYLDIDIDKDGTVRGLF